MQKTISMAQLAKQTARIAADIETRGTVYRIRHPGHRTMILMDKDYFESRLLTLEFKLRHPNWKQEMDEGVRQARAGMGIPLEQYLAERGLEDDHPPSPRRKAAGRPARSRRAKNP